MGPRMREDTGGGVMAARFLEGLGMTFGSRGGDGLREDRMREDNGQKGGAGTGGSRTASAGERRCEGNKILRLRLG